MSHTNKFLPYIECLCGKEICGIQIRTFELSFVPFINAHNILAILGYYAHDINTELEQIRKLKIKTANLEKLII